MIRPALAVTLTLATTACVVPIRMDSICRAYELPGYVGQPYTPEIYRTLKKRTQARRIRLLGPGMMATMDHDPRRMTMTLDSENRITDLRCG